MSTETMIHRTDAAIRDDVERELDWVPGLDSDSIGVGVTDGVVVLSGQVPHYWLRPFAASAALRIRGVQAVANEIDVVFEGVSLTDTDIAEAITHLIRTSATIPEASVTAEVQDGNVTLRGSVGFDWQRRWAEKQVHTIRGVRSVRNDIALSPRPSASETRERIIDALRRNAVTDARSISVGVDGTVITLMGTVRSWDEKHQAEIIAWKSPNVTEVHNHLTVTPREP